MRLGIYAAIFNVQQRFIVACLHRFLASLRHPNIVNFMEAFVGEASMDVYIVMEYADGGDVQEKVKACLRSRERLDENLIWSYFIQMLEGIAHLHSKSILHRDLKTANMFLTMDGHVKIGDLNVSKLAKQGMAATQIGTPYYMSPEIFRGKPYNDKSDIWSLGCILYELTTLAVPFKGRDIEELARRVQTGYYARIPSSFSRELDAVIRACLKLNPSHRPSAAQMLEMPIVVERNAKLRQWMNATLDIAAAIQHEPLDMLATIAAPKGRVMPSKMRVINDLLPAARYGNGSSATGSTGGSKGGVASTGSSADGPKDPSSHRVSAASEPSKEDIAAAERRRFAAQYMAARRGSDSSVPTAAGVPKSHAAAYGAPQGGAAQDRRAPSAASQQPGQQPARGIWSRQREPGAAQQQYGYGAYEATPTSRSRQQQHKPLYRDADVRPQAGSRQSQRSAMSKAGAAAARQYGAAPRYRTPDRQGVAGGGGRAHAQALGYQPSNGGQLPAVGSGAKYGYQPSNGAPSRGGGGAFWGGVPDHPDAMTPLSPSNVQWYNAGPARGAARRAKGAYNPASDLQVPKAAVASGAASRAPASGQGQGQAQYKAAYGRRAVAVYGGAGGGGARRESRPSWWG